MTRWCDGCEQREDLCRCRPATSQPPTRLPQEPPSRAVAPGRLAAGAPSPYEARIRAATLREAADAWQRGQWTIITPKAKAKNVIGAAQVVTDWLRERADRSHLPDLH